MGLFLVIFFDLSPILKFKEFFSICYEKSCYLLSSVGIEMIGVVHYRFSCYTTIIRNVMREVYYWNCREFSF